MFSYYIMDVERKNRTMRVLENLYFLPEVLLSQPLQIWNLVKDCLLSLFLAKINLNFKLVTNIFYRIYFEAAQYLRVTSSPTWRTELPSLCSYHLVSSYRCKITGTLCKDGATLLATTYLPNFCAEVNSSGLGTVMVSLSMIAFFVQKSYLSSLALMTYTRLENSKLSDIPSLQYYKSNK